MSPQVGHGIRLRRAPVPAADRAGARLPPVAKSAARRAEERGGTLYQARVRAWREHIAAAGPGGWRASARSRAGLPLAEHMTDGNRSRLLVRMVREGHLARTHKGLYTVPPAPDAGDDR